MVTAKRKIDVIGSQVDQSNKVVVGEGGKASSQVAKNGSSRCIVKGISAPLKRKLLEAQESSLSFLAERDELEEEDGAEEDKGGHGKERGRKKRSKNVTGQLRFYIDLPPEAVTAFMTSFCQASNPADLPSSDWSVLKVLLRSQTVALKAFPSLLPSLLASSRADVLAHILQFSPDLSEAQAVRILCWASTLDSTSMEHILISKGELFWRGQDPMKKKKTSKAKKSISIDLKEEYSEGKEDFLPLDAVPCSGPLELLRALCEAVLRRSAGLSRTLLAAALAKHPLSLAAVLLQVFTRMLQGLTFTTRAAVHMGTFNDRISCRAIDWAEASIDAHFSSLAMSLVAGNAVATEAIRGALKAIGAVGDATDDVEELMGLWSHISRINKMGRNYLTPPFEVYKVETLTF